MITSVSRDQDWTYAEDIRIKSHTSALGTRLNRAMGQLLSRLGVLIQNSISLFPNGSLFAEAHSKHVSQVPELSTR